MLADSIFKAALGILPAPVAQHINFRADLSRFRTTDNLQTMTIFNSTSFSSIAIAWFFPNPQTFPFYLTPRITGRTNAAVFIPIPAENVLTIIREFDLGRFKRKKVPRDEATAIRKIKIKRDIFFMIFYGFIYKPDGLQFSGRYSGCCAKTLPKLPGPKW